MGSKNEVLKQLGIYPTVSNNPPSKKTMREMAEFFAKTSVPRILATETKKKVLVN